MTRARGGLLLAAVLIAAVVVSRCESVPLTAPAGSSIFLQANPAFVPANGGRSLVTALVVEPAGTLVADGTQVLFLTDLGTIDASAKTVDGLARVYFVSDARSGTATVTAMSGGQVTEPTAEPTATPGASGPSLHTSRDASEATRLGARAAAGAAVAAAIAAEATVTIEVGAMLPTRVVVGADPLRITSQRRSTIVANVYDERGNPVQNVPVIFRILSVEEGSPTTTTTTTTTTTSTTSSTTTTTTTLPPLPFEERLESGGAPRYTDSSGQAFDVLRTTDPVGGVQKIVTIEATTSNGVSGQVVVAID